VLLNLLSFRADQAPHLFLGAYYLHFETKILGFVLVNLALEQLGMQVCFSIA